MKNGKRKSAIAKRARASSGAGRSDSAVVTAHAESTYGAQALGLHSQLTFGDDANVRSLVSSTMVPLWYQGGVVRAGVVRFCPGDFLSSDCIANLYGGPVLQSIAGDDSAAQLLIEPGDMYSVTGCSIEFVPEVVFLDRGGSFVVSRYNRNYTADAGPVLVQDQIVPLFSTTAWPLEAAAGLGVYPQELENVNRFEFNEFTLAINPLDPENGHMFTRRDPPDTVYGSAAEAAVAFLDSPEYLSKVAAWGMVQIEYIAPAGMPDDRVVVGHFRIRRSIQEVYLPGPLVPISFTTASGIAPAIVLPDEVKEVIYEKESELAVRNLPVTGPDSFKRAMVQIGDQFKGVFDGARGLAVGVQSALASGVSYIREHPEVAKAAVQAAAMLLTRGRAGSLPIKLGTPGLLLKM